MRSRLSPSRVLCSALFFLGLANALGLEEPAAAQQPRPAAATAPVATPKPVAPPKPEEKPKPEPVSSNGWEFDEEVARTREDLENIKLWLAAKQAQLRAAEAST